MGKSKTECNIINCARNKGCSSCKQDKIYKLFIYARQQHICLHLNNIYLETKIYHNYSAKHFPNWVCCETKI